MHKKVHRKELCIQLHLLLEHGDWDLQPPITNFIRAGGAMIVPPGVTIGNKKSCPSGQCQPYCSGLRFGGSGHRELFIVAAARWALRMFCLNDTSVGGGNNA